MALTAAQSSCPCGRISLVSRMNPPNPLPSHQGLLSSTVYEYLIPTAPLTQSSDPPAAASLIIQKFNQLEILVMD